MRTYEPGWLTRFSYEFLAPCRPRSALRSYQSEHAVPFLLANPKSALYVDMGLGKTAVVLTVLDQLLASGDLHKALIVAPMRVAVQTWPTEIRAWRHTAWMRHSLIRPDPYDPQVAQVQRWARANDLLSPNHAASKAQTAEYEIQRAVAAMSDAPIHLINREQVTWLVGFHGKNWPYDCVIIDESTSFADHTSQRWKSLAKVAQRTKRLHLLSGTPAPEGLQDLFAQVYLMDTGKRFGRSITSFRHKYMMQNPYTKKWTPQLGAVDQVTNLISDVCLVMKEADYLDVREAVVIERPILLDKVELAEYRQFQKTLILTLAEADIEAVNAGVLSQKLLQYASGAVLDADRKYHVVHDRKLEEMHELVAENAGKPLLVAYWHRSSLDRLRKAFPKATVMDRDAACVKDWNDGKLNMLLIHPQSAGHGLNMQLGPGHILIYFDTPASLELYQQTNKRIDRPGQKALVRIIHLVTRGTLDAVAVAKLTAKESMQDAITDCLRELRKSLRKAA